MWETQNSCHLKKNLIQKMHFVWKDYWIKFKKLLQNLTYIFKILWLTGLLLYFRFIAVVFEILKQNVGLPRVFLIYNFEIM